MVEFERELASNSTKMNEVDYAAWAHHKLVEIHPFNDGNGRVARLLQNILLIQKGYPPTVILKTDRPRCYRTLSQADQGNLRPFADFVARSIERSLNLYLEAFRGSDFELISLARAEKMVPYSQDYLSLQARRALLGAIKLQRNWYTTRKDLEDYLSKHSRKPS